MRTLKIIGLAAIMLSFIVTGNLFAQTAPVGIGNSPQNDATQGRFRSDADNFIRPDSYKSVNFENIFLFSSFADATTARLGFAKKFGETYFAAHYAGSFLSGINGTSYSEQDQPFGTGWKTLSTYDTLPGFSSTPQNRITVLLGFADMGFRFSLGTTYDSHSFDQAYVTGSDTYYKSYESGYGVIAPELQWAMTKPLLEKGIQPKITADLAFYRNNSEWVTYTDPLNSSATAKGLQANNSFRPTITLESGAYTLHSGESGFRLSADLTYVLGIRSYSAEYSYYDGNNYKTNTFSGYNAAANIGAGTEYSYTSNAITPTLMGQWSGETIGLRFRLNLPLTFVSETSTVLGQNASGKLVKNGADTSTLTTTFAPNLQLAAQWKLVPNKLNINAGARLYLSSVTGTSTDYDTYNNGVAGNRTSQERSSTGFSNTANQMTLGVTFFATENLTFEATSGVGYGRINVFSTGVDGLLYFTNILASLKF